MMINFDTVSNTCGPASICLNNELNYALCLSQLLLPTGFAFEAISPAMPIGVHYMTEN